MMVFIWPSLPIQELRNYFMNWRQYKIIGSNPAITFFSNNETVEFHGELYTQ